MEEGSLCRDLLPCSTEAASSALGSASIRVDSSLSALCFSTITDLRRNVTPRPPAAPFIPGKSKLEGLYLNRESRDFPDSGGRRVVAAPGPYSTRMPLTRSCRERSATRGRQGSPWRYSTSAHSRRRRRAAGWRRATNRGCVSRSPDPSVRGRGIRLPPVSGGAIRRGRCGRVGPPPMARASAPRPGRRSIGRRGRARPDAGLPPPSDSGRRCR